MEKIRAERSAPLPSSCNLKLGIFELWRSGGGGGHGGVDRRGKAKGDGEDEAARYPSTQQKAILMYDIWNPWVAGQGWRLHVSETKRRRLGMGWCTCVTIRFL